MGNFEVELAKLVAKEQVRLERKIMLVRSSVVDVMERELGRKVFYISKNDEYRLLTFDIWSRKYAVSMSYILNTLVPLYLIKYTRRKDTKHGFGTRIATLTGRHAEVELVKRISWDYPNRENVEIERQTQKEFVIEERELRKYGAEEFPERRKTLMDFHHPNQYVQYYRRMIRQERKVYFHEEADKRNRFRRYRGSPW